MAYVRRRRTPLSGTTSTLLLSAGANAVVPGSGAFVGTGLSILDSLFGGTATNDKRVVRVNWTLQEANQGSTTAAALIVAAPDNVANDEAGYWRTALTKVNPMVLAQSTALYPFGLWPKGLPDFYTDVTGQTHQAIVREVQAAGGSPTSPTPAAQMLGPMTSSAPYNYVPVLIVGGLSLAAFFYAQSGNRRRRSA